MKVDYKPLWLIESTDANDELNISMLVTKSMPTSDGFHSTLINTRTEQIALGIDLYNLSKLEDIYSRARDETEELLNRLVRSWYFTRSIKEMANKRRAR